MRASAASARGAMTGPRALTTFLLLLVAPVAGCRGSDERDPPDAPFVFVVEALSRGSGVPEEARDVLGETRKLVESARTDGSAVSLSEARIGLEGETRLRVECADPQIGRELYRKVHGLAGGVDLVTVTEEKGATGH